MKREVITNTKIDLRLLFMKSTLRRKSDYTHAKGKVTFECKICGSVYERRWMQIKNQNGKCKMCYDKQRIRASRGETKRLFQEKTKRNGFEIIGEYINGKTKVLCKKCGWIYEILPHSYVYDNSNPHIFYRNTHALDNFKTWMDLHKNDSQYGQSVIDSEVWNGTNNKLKFYCYIHDYVYSTTPNNKMSSNTLCPKCARQIVDETTLHYSVFSAEKNKLEWQTIPAIVYTIYCYDLYESFFKIGITKFTVDQRYKYGACIPYSYKIVDEIKTNLYEAVLLEYELHKKNEEYSYRPMKNFGGVTECFYDLF